MRRLIFLVAMPFVTPAEKVVLASSIALRANADLQRPPLVQRRCLAVGQHRHGSEILAANADAALDRRERARGAAGRSWASRRRVHCMASGGGCSSRSNSLIIGTIPPFDESRLSARLTTIDIRKLSEGAIH
jgi:hypothetical protein